MLAALLLVLGQVPGLPNPEGPIFSSPSLGASFAFFEFAPANGRGMTAPCACTTPTGANGEALNFARASVAECYSNDGQTLTQCAAGQPRVSSGDVTSPVVGLWVEALGTRQNDATRSRDLSNAVWTKTTMTCARTATGMRNDVNGASTCTATAANGTVLQAMVLAAATRNTSLHIKRRTGTGVVEVTRDNGTTWTAITASLSSSVWRRVVSEQAPGCIGGNCIVVAAMTSGIANPTIGIRLGTNGDAVDVDFVQDEGGAFPSSPIETVATAASRVDETADVVKTLGLTAGGCGSATIVGGASSHGLAGGGNLGAILSRGATGGGIDVSMYVWPFVGAGNAAAVDGTPVVSAGATGFGAGPAFPQGSTRIVWRHSSLWTACVDATCSSSAASTWNPAADLTRIIFHRSSAAASNTMAHVVKRVQIDPVSTRCDAL